MKILYIASKPAYPKIDGGCVASANFLSNLLDARMEIKYLTISTDKHPFDASSFPSAISINVNPESVKIETAVKPLDAFKSLFKKGSYNIDRFYDEAFKTKIQETTTNNKFDLIILDGLYTTPYLQFLREIFHGKVLLRTHNVEFKIWEGLAINEKNPVKKKYLKTLAKDLKNYEKQVLSDIDGIMTLSKGDLSEFDSLGIKTPKCVIPVTVSPSLDNHNYQSNTLFHLGIMNWTPNIEAVQQVVDLMPAIRLKNKQLKFKIAGKHSEDEFDTDLAAGIVVNGYVDDLNTFVSEMGILVSPIRSGSGIRIKILEMMAMGIPVITTELGAQGLEDYNAIKIANSEQEILDAVYELANDENKRRDLGLKAKSYVNLHHNPLKVSPQLVEFIKSI